MDPNANLEEQLQILSSVFGGELVSKHARGHKALVKLALEKLSMPKETKDRLLELDEALTDWIANGGFLPEAWEDQSSELDNETLRTEVKRLVEENERLTAEMSIIKDDIDKFCAAAAVLATHIKK